ncbi:MAG: hypothetical protein K6T65_01100 [Peptococcaceae bacterium]|nr:hypothetical protein [Peptococcaceae bacterium]
MGGVTVWDTVFMMITVIPVSKMFSSIFMKIIARMGTVDQEKWAAIGLGALGATYGLMKKGGLLGTMGNTAGQSFKPGSPGAPGQGGPGGVIPGMPGAGPVGDSGVPGESPAFGGRISPGGLGASGRTGTGSYSGYSAADAGGGYTEGGGAGLSASPGAGAEFNGYMGAGNVPERGGRKLEDIINIASQAGHKFSKGAAFAGMASSFAIPEVAPIMAGVYGMAGKASAGFASTAYHLSNEIKERKKNGQDFWGAMKEMTGTGNRVAATTKVAATLTLSPMGGRVSAFGIQAPGRVHQWAKSRFGNGSM